jgi:uncharacterized protein YecE (DUF72 family)
MWGMCAFTGAITSSGFRKKATVAERYDYLYSMDELEPWADRVKSVAKRSKDMYAITNNHHVGKAIANAVELAALVAHTPLKIPAEWAAHYPELKLLARAEN